MHTTTLNLHLHHHQQGSSLRVPITLSAGTRELRIAYEYARRQPREVPGGQALDEVAVIDLALEMPDGRLCGASGSERQEITVNEAWATPGYRPARLVAGDWQVVLGLYKLPAAGCQVKLTITQHGARELLLVGDTHVHTHHSDGRYSPQELASRAVADGLDFLCICDHNTQSALRHLPSTPELTIIPGMELTWYRGHCNLYGVLDPVLTYVANSDEQALAIIREGVARDALLSVNHPFYPGCEWLLGEDLPPHLLEVWNGPFVAHNQQALAHWQQTLAAGRRQNVIGGSDAHRAQLFRLPGAPATFVYSASRMPSDILAAMREGQCFIGMDQDAPRLRLQYGQTVMGGVADWAADTRLLFTIHHLGAQDELRVITQDGPALVERPGERSVYSQELPLKQDTRFARLEVWRALPGLGLTLASLSNPIYFEAGRADQA
ncbi:MAG: CehA/McbA family metallohydrolase [Clostridiales bacterium]|nr:CehA/McbA family metallohydrolase [Clostridiales bacterium]